MKKMIATLCKTIELQRFQLKNMVWKDCNDQAGLEDDSDSNNIGISEE